MTLCRSRIALGILFLTVTLCSSQKSNLAWGTNPPLSPSPLPPPPPSYLSPHLYFFPVGGNLSRSLHVVSASVAGLRGAGGRGQGPLTSHVLLTVSQLTIFKRCLSFYLSVYI